MFLLDTGGSGGVTVVVSEVDDTETNVTGLTPSVLYTFSVTAENDVSSQDKNSNVRTVTTTETTEEGGLFWSQTFTLLKVCVNDWVLLIKCLWNFALCSYSVLFVDVYVQLEGQ